MSCAITGTTPLDARDPYVGLREREAVPKVLDLTVPQQEHRLVVKFVDEARVRVHDGALSSHLGLDLGPVTRVAEQKNVQIDYRPLVQLDDASIDRVESRAAQNTGVRPIDVRAMYVVEAPQRRLEEIGEALAQLDIVEWVEFEIMNPEPPACADIAPASNSLSHHQGYFADFHGMNIDGARAGFAFSRGAGVNIADVEYGANGAHEDLCGIVFESGQSIPSFVFSNGWDSHGTAVIGIMMATENAYGVTGIAPDADPYFFPENSTQQGSRRATAITNAAATLDVGDVIVLEMQTIVYGDNYGPAELSFSVWNAVKNAVDAGLVVVAAAGNGDQNLDSAVYAPYTNRGDSGAIIVGAGTNGGAPNKLSFSTYGSRVSVQGWGTGVASTGYGGLATYGGDKNQRYTSSFNGTSSATPTVAGVVAIMQGYAKEVYEETLTCQQIRQIMIETGVPQNAGGLIGPRPDAEMCLERIDEMFELYCEADFNRDGDVDLGDFGIFGAAFNSRPGDSNWEAIADFNEDGDVDLGDFGVFGSQFNSVGEDCNGG